MMNTTKTCGDSSSRPQRSENSLSCPVADAAAGPSHEPLLPVGTVADRTAGVCLNGGREIFRPSGWDILAGSWETRQHMVIPYEFSRKIYIL